MSDLFGGLIKPGVGGRTALRLELDRRRAAHGHRFPAPEYTYRGGADMCLRHGQDFNGRITPEEYRHLSGPNMRCYMNTLEACEADRSLRYFEGYYSWGKGHFTSHAWCVGPDDGVVELSVETWRVHEGEVHDKRGGRILPPAVWTYWGIECDVALL